MRVQKAGLTLAEAQFGGGFARHRALETFYHLLSSTPSADRSLCGVARLLKLTGSSVSRSTDLPVACFPRGRSFSHTTGSWRGSGCDTILLPGLSTDIDVTV